MRELDKEFKELRLYGMAGAWEDLVKQGGHAPRWRARAGCWSTCCKRKSRTEPCAW